MKTLASKFLNNPLEWPDDSDAVTSLAKSQYSLPEPAQPQVNVSIPP